MLFWTLLVVLSFAFGGEANNSILHENEIDDQKQGVVKSPAVKLFNQVDIFELANISVKDQGVSLVEGPIPQYPAYKFRVPYGNVPLTNSDRIVEALSNPKGFTAIFLFRQQKKNLGTLISVNSPGRLTPWFEISSNSKTGMLNVKLLGPGSLKPKQIDWPLPKVHRRTPLAAWTWLTVVVDYELDYIRVDMDCLPSRFEFLSQGRAQTRISIPKESLVYFRQEPGRKKKFLGSMQVAKILPYVTHERMWPCRGVSDHLPPQFKKPMT